ncbi:MAG: SDR family oxidoreductase [candidate division KSB1 bacterium]|jgi:NAD(P)-dependent dehydrogenase (short-subunit alcohol dehydrogenase family)|nr:SDR family oxidoreductase [candidate division KSB1 bacterium]
MEPVRNYLIVGGSSGIGLELTRRIADSGHRVVVASRTSNNLPKADNVSHIQLDVLCNEIPRDALPERLNGLAYCPGSITLRPFRQLKEEDFIADVSINLLGAVRTIQCTLTQLRKADKPASIVLFSTVAVQTGMKYHASIASAKGAVEGLTRSLAAEFAPHIRINCIAPSLTDTPLAERLLSSEEKRKASADRHPMKRVGAPEDIARVAWYLLSDDSQWTTGQIFHVDGGMSSLKQF